MKGDWIVHLRMTLEGFPGKGSACQWKTRVQSLIQVTPTGRVAARPQGPQLQSLCSRAWEPQLLSPRAATSEACALQQEKPPQ